MNANEEANLIAAKTFLPKAKNISRRLDDTGFRGLYTTSLDFDKFTVSFTGGPVVECDLSSESTDAAIYEMLVNQYHRMH